MYKTTMEYKVNLVTLTGSSKQVAWAEDIRTAYMERMGKTMDKIVAIDATKAQEAWVKLVAIVNKVTEAKWWIDHQYTIDKGLKEIAAR